MSVPPHKMVPVPTNGPDSICCWLHFWEPNSRLDKETLTRELRRYRVNAEPLDQNSPSGAGICIFSEPTLELRDFLRTVSRAGRERIIAVAVVGGLVNGVCHWDL